jgi:hypothetical protein
VTRRLAIPRVALVVVYLLLTLAGLYLFRGVPLLNVALGFPLGAWIAWRREPSPAALRALLAWGLALAAGTVAIGWLEVALAYASLRVPELFGGLVPWLPLSPHASAAESRAIVFALAAAPALQVLTTVFGGVVVLVSRPNQGHPMA